LSQSVQTVSSMKECPICLEEMDVSDAKYPVLCPTKCGYNFCTRCVDQFVKSSKSDYEEASDGSRQVKIHLLCPQCRGNVSNTIHDTLIMRKAHKASVFQKMNDSELNATELRVKYEFTPEDAQAFRDAQARLAKFHSDHYCEDDYDTCLESLSIEVELSPRNCNGSTIHPQSKTSTTTTAAAGVAEEKKDDPKTTSGSENNDYDLSAVDTSLFNGLEYYMSDAEQIFVSNMMISGKPNQLAQAAEILNSISQMALQGLTPSVKRHQNTKKTADTANASGRKYSNTTNNANAAKSRTERLAEKERLEEMAREKIRNPLPVRMPRFATLTVFQPNTRTSPLIFVDDEWDGFVGDAYGRNGKVTMSNTKNLTVGMKNILSTATKPVVVGTNKASAYDYHRIKIETVKGEAGRLGFQPGDIITHVDSIPLEGTQTAEELHAMISKRYNEDPTQLLPITVNAEPSAAEILKLRAQVLSKIRSYNEKNNKNKKGIKQKR